MAPNVFNSSRSYGPFTSTTYYAIAIAIIIRLKNGCARIFVMRF